MVVAALAAVSFVAACASSFEEISPALVSSNQFNDLDCSKLSLRAEILAGNASRATGYRSGRDPEQKQIIKFVWPPAFRIKADPEQLLVLQSMRGEVDALATATVAKRCSLWIVQETSSEFPLSIVPPLDRHTTEDVNDAP